MSKRIRKSMAAPLKERAKTQMEYYMGAKLLEIGIEPKSAIYRWAIEDKGDTEMWTYSAYWGDSKEKMQQNGEL